MLKPINLFSLPRNTKNLSHSYLPKCLNLRVAACFALAIGFLIVIYRHYRNLTSKSLCAESPSLYSNQISPSTTPQPEPLPLFSTAPNFWTVYSSPDRIIAAFGRDLDPNTGKNIWTSGSFSLKEGQFSLSIQHEPASEEFSIFLHCINSLGAVQVNYQYTMEGREISGKKILDVSQAEPPHLLGKITLSNTHKPPLISLMVTLKSLAKA